MPAAVCTTIFEGSDPEGHQRMTHRSAPEPKQTPDAMSLLNVAMPALSEVSNPKRRLGISPILKWAGGKRQLLTRLVPKVPASYDTFIEPFFGGGALFFALLPNRAVISDSNPELIHFYLTLRDSIEDLIDAASRWSTDESTFYRVRKMDPCALSEPVRAARTLYLNRTCFNGLYRVNASGDFNVPYGRYDNPRVVDESALRAASTALASATIVCADYLQVLGLYAHRGDFVFLDPPYMPVSKSADFKRYTKVQFRAEDHAALAGEVTRLSELGCSVVLTNSNTPEIRSLYAGLACEVLDTRRAINCDGLKRFGEDLVVQAPALPLPLFPPLLSSRVKSYPSTRFMGSKEKLLSHIWRAAAQLSGHRVLDLFSGSGCVAYMFKCQNKAVTTNDYMAFPHSFATAMVENNSTLLSLQDVAFLTHGKATDRFVRDTFADLYFCPNDNLFIDLVRTRVAELGHPLKAALARTALIRACLKKRARGIFTYTGLRYDDGRRDMQLSLRRHFQDAVATVNDAVFDNGCSHRALRGDALAVDVEADIVYIDPPYFSRLSDNDYVRRYHFVEGLAQDWKGLEIQGHTKTKKFKTYGSSFSTHQGAIDGFRSMFRRYADSALIVSYSSNSLPNKDSVLALMQEVKRDVEVIRVDHQYSFGNQGHKIANSNNKVQEYLFVAR
jgi:DNA adenine methylase